MAGKPRTYPPAEELLEQVEGSSVSAVARALGIPRPTLQAHVAKLRSAPAEAIPDDGLAEAPDADLIPVIFRDYSSQDELLIYPVGDLHVGAPAYQEQRLREWLAYLEGRKETSLLNTGDNINAAIVGSVSDVYTENLQVGEAWRHVRDLFRPLAEQDRIDAIGQGNHEARIYRAIGDEPMRTVAEELDVPYWSVAALIVYQVGEVEYEVFVRHGSGGGATAGAKANRLQKQRNTLPTADVFVSGHTHTQLVFPEDILLRDGDRLIRRKQLFVSSGSFLGLEAYAVVNGLAPSHVGAPRIRLDGRRRDPHVSV